MEFGNYLSANKRIVTEKGHDECEPVSANPYDIQIYFSGIKRITRSASSMVIHQSAFNRQARLICEG